MTSNKRLAGLGLITFAVGGLIAFTLVGAPGGEYEADLVDDFITGSHTAAFAGAYIGAISSLGLLAFAQGMRDELTAGAEYFKGLAIAGVAVSVVGWFVVGGIAVSIAEGGDVVRDSLPHTVAYTLGEIGNLLSICAGAFFAGLMAMMVGVRASLPGWLRAFSVFAGVCGVLAPLFFTYFLFVLWGLVFGIWAVVSRDRAPAARRTESLV